MQKTQSQFTIHCGEKTQVMAGFRPFLNILKAYHSENFHGERRMITTSILRAILFGIFAMEFMTTVLLLWRWIDDNFSLYSLAISTGIVGVQVAASNISMMVNNRKISSTFDYMEMVLDTRNSIHLARNLKECIK